MGEFKGITGLGHYKTRDRRLVVLDKKFPHNSPYPWSGVIVRDGQRCTWTDNGELVNGGGEMRGDIVEVPLSDEPAMAGLTGFAGVQGDRLIPFKTAEQAFEYGWESVIDLSTIRKDQLIRSEPKRETRKVTLVMYRNGAVHQWSGPVPAQWNPPPDIIAIVERDIEFPHGEGLARP